MSLGDDRGRGSAGRRLADAWLVLLSPLVPRARRADWLEEWRAEVDALETRSEGGRSLGARLRGALADALYLRLHREAGAGGSAGGTAGWTGELRLAARSLARRPGLTAVSLVTLSLGIGVNAALFTVAHAVLLRPLPFAEPDRIVRLWGKQDGELSLGGSVSYPDVRSVGERVAAVEAWSAFDEWRPAIGDEGSAPEVVYGATVNAGFFDLLGVEPALGRFFREDEEGEGRELRVVITHGLWQRSFGADATLIAGSILVNGSPAEVIGVLPADFETPGLEGGSWGAPEIWRTVATPPEFRSARSWGGVARLREGVSLEAAQAEADAVTASLEREFPDENAGWGIGLVPLREQLLGDSERVLGLLLGAVALVLLIACANVAGLLLVRAVERRRELDVRVALGATVPRLVGTAMLESLMLTTVGAGLGLGLAVLLVDALRSRLDVVLPRTQGIAVDALVVAGTAAVAVAAGLLLGLVPAADAWIRSRRGATSSVARGARGASAGVEGVRLRRALVGGQVAVAVVLLVGAGLLLRSLAELHRVDLGMERGEVLTASLHSAAFIDLSPEEAQALYGDLMARLASLPGVRAAGAINILPLAGGFSCDGVTRDDLPAPSPRDDRCAEIRAVLGGTLEALGIPVLRGRSDVEADHRAGAARVVIVSEEMAETFWPGEEPLGKRVTIHGESWEVVGVARNVRHFGPAGTTRPQAYIPAALDPWGGVGYGLSLVVRAAAGAERLAPAVRETVAAVNPELAIVSVATLDDLLGRSLSGSSFRAVLLGAFAALAVVLAMVGLGGVVAYSVRQRTREIGVRMAVGASRRALTGMVLRESARIVILGATVGVALALLAASALESLVFGVGVRDPWTVVAAPFVVALAGLAVSWIPARRAARVDPLRALASD